ncbi:glycosyltransferase family 4 protein [Polaromonas sp.]|uniref:glycosyltransferase family 4 protein n=1 Tax=Polaromonas sp. TaxID=1869339 RepID=UPI002FC84915
MTSSASQGTGQQDDHARRLRIAVFNRIFSPTGGGAERYSIALVEQLAQAHEIHVFAQQIDHAWPGVNYHLISAPLRKPRWINQLWFATATWWATRRGFDVVHSHENTWHGEVQTVHVLPVKHNLFHGRTGWRRALRWVKVLTSPRLLVYCVLERLRYAAQTGRHVVVTSDSLKKIMAVTYPVCAETMSVITPGIAIPVTPTSDARKQQARVQLGLPKAARCLLFIGNDYRKKGLPALLEALPQLPEDVVLAVVGNPAQVSAFKKTLEGTAWGQRVFFLGALQDVSPAYEAADCLVHPTLEDTFAMVVLEAMAHGLPVIVSSERYCGISGLLRHGVNALILDDPKNAKALAASLSRLLGDGALQRQLGEQAEDFARQHQWETIAREQEKVYFSAVQAKNRLHA